jgi:hypothetical protein
MVPCSRLILDSRRTDVTQFSSNSQPALQLVLLFCYTSNACQGRSHYNQQGRRQQTEGTVRMESKRKEPKVESYKPTSVNVNTVDINC